MQEHPIPQDITGYRFHIIGSMTLKQFGEILLGVIIAVILYKTNLISLIKWPLIAISVGVGAAAAFLPIEERPLDHWIITFFRIMYKPTQFYWRREPHIPEPFNYVPTKIEKEEITLDLTPAKRQRIKEYVSAIPEISSTSQDFTQEEVTKMQNILSSFATVRVAETNIIKQEIAIKNKPRIDVRVRKMRKPSPQQETVIFGTDQTKQIENTAIYEDNTQKLEITTPQQTPKTILSSDQVAQNIEIPKEKIIKSLENKHETKQTTIEQKGINDTSEKSYLDYQDPTTSPTLASQEVLYNQDLPFPIKPTEPNKVVGMVLSKNNDLLTNAIVEIQTQEGAIVRAVKTNALGQFFVSTPLNPGVYVVVAEKTNYQFKPQLLTIENKIIPPMEIRSEN